MIPDETVDVEPMEAPPDAALTTVRALAIEQVEAEDRVARLERELEAAKRALAAVRDDRLPKAMAALGLDNFQLDNGVKLEVRDVYRCGQLDDAPDDPEKSKDRRPRAERMAALEWLDEHEHGALARRVVSLVMGAESEELARELIELVRRHPGANKFQVDQRRLVPWNTLAAFVREQVEQGEELPLDVLGVTAVRCSKITLPKKEKF